MEADMEDQLARDELLRAHHILLGTLCGVLKVLQPEVIEAVRETLTEKLAEVEGEHPAVRNATARALAMIPPDA